MKNRLKQFVTQFNDSIDRWQETQLVQRLNITSQVAWNLFLIIAVFILLSVTFVSAAGAGYFVSLVEDEPEHTAEEMKAAIYDYEETSEVYFSNEEFMGELPAILERREMSLEDMSDYVIQAIIATEDENFYEHDGIVPRAIMRATFQELANTSTQTGGSTLTQQIVKNQMLSSDVSFDRKAREMVLALRLENYMDKEEILEAYLNIVPFGRNASGRQIAGIDAAATGIFGVDASELNLPQAAFIAGLPQNPFTYAPFHSDGSIKEDLSAGLARMEIVLSRMKDSGIIDESAHEEALAYDLEESFTDSSPSLSSFDNYPYVTNETERRASYILRDLFIEEDEIDLGEMDSEERQATMDEYLGKAHTQLRSGGYRIHTTIEKDIYDAMEETVTENTGLFGPDDQEGEPEEIGAALIDNETGALLSFVGGRDFERENLNHATQAYRHNGSTMKPLMPYASAMERGYVQPAFVVPDVPASYSSGQNIRNFGGGYHGLIPVRDSLKHSRNVPAVQTFKQIPVEEAREDLLNMGFSLHEHEPYESIALGALEYGVTVEQNTSAFTLFGNEGKRQESFMIERIETHDGETIYEHETEAVDVFSTQTAYLTIDMMRDVLSEGTASTLPGRMNFGGDWAGKTGTSNDFHDSWFVGLNPKVTFGVWIGYDNPQPIQQQWNGMSYSQRTQQLWATLMNAAVESNSDPILTDERFEAPEGIVRQSVCGISGLLPSSLCYDAGLVYTDLFNSEHLPSQTDDSLQSASYVTINGQNYRALEETPSEFTSSGVSVNSSFFEGVNLQEHLSDNVLGNIVPNQSAPTTGHQPAAIAGVSANGGQLSWTQHPDPDIVGYRVYTSGGSLAASIRGNTSTNYAGISAGQGYYVTAVDTLGRESNTSNTATSGQISPSEGNGNGNDVDADEEPASNGNGNEDENGNGSNDDSTNEDGNGSDTDENENGESEEPENGESSPETPPDDED